MARTAVLLVAVVAASTAVSFAETTAPYAGQEVREIKALDRATIEGLRRGAGLGFAISAELNGWPGPLHVLELADALKLSEAQRADIASIRSAMLAETVPLGTALIEAEAALELLLGGNPDRAAINEATSKIGALRAKLRSAHIAAHLKTAPVLTRYQKMIYARQRGYASTAPGHQHGKPHK